MILCHYVIFLNINLNLYKILSYSEYRYNYETNQFKLQATSNEL
jgi:hypothetical protein